MVNDVTPDGPILSVAEAKRRYILYIVMKLAGLAALFGGVFLARDGATAAGLVLLGIGGATLFVRPRAMGLTTPKPPKA